VKNWFHKVWVLKFNLCRYTGESLVAKETLYEKQLRDSSFHVNMCQLQAQAKALAELFNEQVTGAWYDLFGASSRKGYDIRESRVGAYQLPLVPYKLLPPPTLKARP
jgi:hypothetical protein